MNSNPYGHVNNYDHDANHQYYNRESSAYPNLPPKSDFDRAAVAHGNNFHPNQPQHHQPNNVVVINNENAPRMNVSDYCNSCKSVTNTEYDKKLSKTGCIWCVILGVIGFECCLCFIPYCMDSCKEEVRVCARCKKVKQTFV